FAAIDFPAGTLSPSGRAAQGGGWRLTWRFDSLVTGQKIGMDPPDRLNPGPLASRITFFAPVSLLFFMAVMVMLGVVRRRSLHPMNYFFLAAAFFSFHLLLAYLVDHISIHLSFIICSAVSLFLVVSYLRLVVGLRFAAVEAAAAQFLYLVLFSYAFFFKGLTAASASPRVGGGRQAPVCHVASLRRPATRALPAAKQNARQAFVLMDRYLDSALLETTAIAFVVMANQVHLLVVRPRVKPDS